MKRWSRVILARKLMDILENEFDDFTVVRIYIFDAYSWIFSFSRESSVQLETISAWNSFYLLHLRYRFVSFAFYWPLAMLRLRRRIEVN